MTFKSPCLTLNVLYPSVTFVQGHSFTMQIYKKDSTHANIWGGKLREPLNLYTFLFLISSQHKDSRRVRRIGAEVLKILFFFDVAGLVAIEDAVDGVVAGYILNLTSAEIISFCEGFDVCLRQCRYHLMPDVHTSL